MTLEEAVQWCIENGVTLNFTNDVCCTVYEELHYEANVLGQGATLIEAVQDAMRDDKETTIARLRPGAVFVTRDGVKV